jgi:hypothetical protein
MIGCQPLSTDRQSGGSAPRNFAFKAIASPVGLLKLVARDAGLAAVLWENDDPHRVRLGPMVRNPRT